MQERRSKTRTQYKIVEVSEDYGNYNGMYFELWSKGWSSLFIWAPAKGRWNFETMDAAKVRISELNQKHVTKRKEVWAE